MFGLYHGGAEQVTLSVPECPARREATRRRAGGQAVWMVMVVGPQERGEQVIARPFDEAVLPGGDELGAALHSADARFARTVVAGHPHR